MVLQRSGPIPQGPGTKAGLPAGLAGDPLRGPVIVQTCCGQEEG